MLRILLIILLLNTTLFAQQSIHGMVYELSGEKEQPMPLANVFWVNSSVGTTTDSSGHFMISSEGITDKRLIASFMGYENDTVLIDRQLFVKFRLKGALMLKELKITEERDATMISMKALKTEIITSKELRKAACCNLGESFTTNASVDITYKDAVSGSKEIQVLGLSGSYTQVLTENTPLITGLGLTYGLNSIPGSQVDAISVVKGPGSVIFGHESISGMVNVDLKDPSKADRLFINGYADQNLRKEINIDKAFRFSDRLSMLLSAHADHFSAKTDLNKDGFLDMPVLTNINVLDKWKFDNNKGLFSQNSVKYLYEDRMGGQKTFDYSMDHADSSSYGQKLLTRRFDFYGRTGYVIPSAKFRSVGFQYAAFTHSQSGFYGMRSYSGIQDNIYMRLIYNTEINSSNSLNAGFSYNSTLQSEKFDSLSINKNEAIPGVFAENTFRKNRLIAFIAGVRADDYKGKIFITPRANVKYSLSEKTDLRFSAGTGFRTSSILSENPAILASNRKITVAGDLKPEQAVNIGLNLNHSFTISYRKGTAGLDLYRTVFSNKIIPDYDTNPTEVVFSNLDGKAYSDNLQAEASYKVFKNAELKAAYKYLDVYSYRGGIKIPQPLVSKNRALMSFFYKTFDDKWSVNILAQWFGSKRLPSTLNNPPEYHRPLSSPSYATFNMQFTRSWTTTEVYLGVENILDFRQKDPIVSAGNPYGPYFDTSYVWGPLEGRKIYAGFRFRLPYGEEKQ